jgi:hypothetical protein
MDVFQSSGRWNDIQPYTVDRRRSGIYLEKNPTSPDALFLLLPAGTTTDLPEVPDEGRRCEPDDEYHLTCVREVPGL